MQLEQGESVEVCEPIQEADEDGEGCKAQPDEVEEEEGDCFERFGEDCEGVSSLKRLGLGESSGTGDEDCEIELAEGDGYEGGDEEERISIEIDACRHGDEEDDNDGGGDESGKGVEDAIDGKPEGSAGVAAIFGELWCGVGVTAFGAAVGREVFEGVVAFEAVVLILG